MQEVLIVRPGRVEDAGAISLICQRSFGYPADPQRVAQRLEPLLKKPAYRLFVAEREGWVLGYVQACDYETAHDDPQKLVQSLAVLPEAQGGGIGRALLEKVEQWAREECCAGIRLESGVDRHGAHAFYERCGYTHRKDHRQYVKRF